MNMTLHHYLLKASIKSLLLISLSLTSTNAFAQVNATIEVGDGVINTYTTQTFNQSVFTRINFDGQFASPPNVFTMTPEFPGADDPCTVRIRNISTTGFDATCLEPLSSDRNSPDIPFEYIAVQNGGVTVPSSDGLSSTRFVSSCQFVTAQQGRGINASFFDFNFNTTFNSPPAVIAQVQSTINTVQGSATTPGGEPAFIDVAVENVTTTDVDIAIELGETSTNNLSNGEIICVLAVERTVDNGAAACTSLDFSSLGGPATPVTFQALTSGAIIQGHDNMPCDSVSFANNCGFTSPPTVLAKQNTRNGPDGGFLRRCDTSTGAATFIYDEDQVRDPERSHTGSEAISIFAFSQLFTTPVTLNSAQVSLLKRSALFKWQTSTETFHLGFNLWGETNDGWVQLNSRLIAGRGTDSDETKYYSRAVRLTRQQANEISNFGISSVDSNGYEEFYGPFKDGEIYGEEANNEPVDWTQTRNTFEQSMRERGFVKVNNRWRRLSKSSQARLKNKQLGVNRSQFEIEVQATGIHSIKAGELLALNPRWNRQPLRNIALTLNGKPLPRHIISQNRRLDADDQIVFNAIAPQGDDTPFIENYVYRLSIDRNNVVQANTFNGQSSEESSPTTEALLEQKVTSRKLHSATLTNGDPWHDARLLSIGNVASVEYTVDFDYPINSERGGQIDISLFGGLDFPGAEDDHHIEIYLNEKKLTESRFDGVVEQRLILDIEPGLLTQTGNVVRISATGDTGFFADVVLVDEITVGAFSELSSLASLEGSVKKRQILDFADVNNASSYQADGQSSNSQVFAYTSNGLLSYINTENNDDKTTFTRLPFEASENNPTQLRYTISTPENWPSPSAIRLVTGQDLHSQESNYLIIAHPSFIGDSLNEFVEFKTKLGYNVRVIDWLELVETYGYGNNSPAALDNFLNAANQLYRTDNVLIVGGHTFDYFGISDSNIVNFIPSHYKPVSIFAYTATDNPYADLDGDNIPEIAIGRWPVRSVSDLQTIIKKTKDWHQNRENDQYQSAYLVAQATDGQNLDFTEQLNIRVRNPLSQLENIDSTSMISLDNLPDDVDNAIAFTRASLAEQINNGTDLISFSGHGSPTAWGFQNIVNTSFIQGLENQGEPVLVMPLACFITHYESVSTNTLAHQWLFAGDIGAAAIHGASVLGEYRDNGLFAERYLRHSKSVNTIGEAILNAKKELGVTSETLHNWALLGDPTLPIK